MKYLTKAELYKSVDKLIKELDITERDYPLDSIFLANKFFVNAEITYNSFDGLCAILYRGRKSTSLMLNSRRSKAMQNFDCMHEIIHYFLHTEVNTFQCQSIDSDIVINDFLEWQANEGAAEALLPYRLFIPMYVDFCEKNEDDAVKKLVKHFGVTERVVLNRIDNLHYEIYQYKILRKSVDELEILSRIGQRRKNIDYTSAYNKYCARCHFGITENADYCPACGNNLSQSDAVRSGIGSVSYDKIELLDDMRAAACHVCGNESLIRHGYYCQMCGAPIVNRCTNESKTDSYGFAIDLPCDSLLDGDARFCPTCGSKSSFYKAGLLKSVINK